MNPLDKTSPIAKVHTEALALRELLQIAQTIAWSHPEAPLGTLMDDLAARARNVAFGLEDRTTLGTETEVTTEEDHVTA